MSESYRAAWLEDLPMTGPQHATLPDAALIDAAVAVGYRIGAIGDAPGDGWGTEEEFRDALHIGDSAAA